MHPGALQEKSELYRIMTGIRFSSFDVGSSFRPDSIMDPEAFRDSSSFCPQERALAALRNHKEAEKRRRERINSHLDKLRSILSCSSKTDKASLLAKVVDRVRELKQEAAMMERTLQKSSDHSCGVDVIPSESDHVTVYSSSDSGGRLVFKASLCCEDRSDLMPELIGILKSLRLKTMKADMCTMGGRIRNVLMVATADDEHSVESVQFLQIALKGLVQRSSGPSADRSKRIEKDGCIYSYSHRASIS